MKEPRASDTKRNAGREILFRIIAVCLPLVLLLGIEGLLRLFSAGDDLQLFVPNPVEGYEETMIVNPVVGKKYFRKFEYSQPPNDLFLKQKPQGTIRFFVMGSSTVVGFPYYSNLMFSRILHKRLQEAFPDRNIEMVNTAITAINSNTLVDFAGQIARYEPDAVLIYAGHNEFYGAFGAASNEGFGRSRAITRLHLFMMDFRFYQLLSHIGKANKKSEVHGTLMKRIAGNQDISLDSDTYREAMESYQKNMTEVVGEFTRRGIPVYFSEVVSNLKDLKPLIALSSGQENKAWDHYTEGVKAYNKGDYQKAQTEFSEARDLDGVRFRASSEVNSIIREIAKTEGAELVPMESRFREESPHGIVGRELMTEHVHPNIAGNFLMAECFLDAILSSDLLGEPPSADLKPSSYEKLNYGYTELDSLYAVHRVTQIENYWPYVPAGAKISDYRLTYRPVSRRDSLAFDAFRNPEITLNEVRLGLARQFSAERNMYEAYREYEAILRTNPYLALNYRDAASALISLGNLPLALEYFRKSLQIEPSFFASYRVGEIYLIRGDYASARRYFSQAFDQAEVNEDRLKALGKMYQASVYAGQGADAEAIAGQLTRNGAKQYLQIPPPSYTYNRYVPFQTRKQVEKALALKQLGMYPEAAHILQNSLNVYDSHMARRLLGECLLAMKDTLGARTQFGRVKEEFAFDPTFPPVPLN